MTEGRARSQRLRVVLVLAALASIAALLAVTTPPSEEAADPAPATVPDGAAATPTTVASAPGAATEAAAGARPVFRTDGVEGRMDTFASQVSGAQVWDLEVVGTAGDLQIRRRVITDKVRNGDNADFIGSDVDEGIGPLGTSTTSSPTTTTDATAPTTTADGVAPSTTASKPPGVTISSTPTSTDPGGDAGG